MGCTIITTIATIRTSGTVHFSLGSGLMLPELWPHLFRWCYETCRWKLKLRTSAYNLALVGNICCAFLFFPVTRGSSILPLVGLTSEASIKYHIWLGHLAMVLFTAHGLCYSLYWAITHDLEQVSKLSLSVSLTTQIICC